MMAVGWDEGLRCGVGGELCSGRGEQVRSDLEVAAVAESIGLDVADRGFLEIRGERCSGRDEEFGGASSIFDAGPEVVSAVELEQGFGEVAVLRSGGVRVVVGEGAGASPEECARPVAGVG